MKSRGVLFVVGLAAGSALSTVSACGDGAVDVTDGQDSGASSGSVEKASCPKPAPNEGAPCALPENTTCDFGRCVTRIARCHAGSWRYGGNVLPQPACPTTPPQSESACPECWPATDTCCWPPGERCKSDICSGLDGGQGNVAVGGCVAGRWSVAISACLDASTDVQGDGKADAD